MTTEYTAPAQALLQEWFHLYPGEAAQALGRLPPDEIAEALHDKPLADVIQVFVRLNPDVAVPLTLCMDAAFFERLFTALDPAHGAAFLARLSRDDAERLLAILPPGLVREYRDLLSYPTNSAGQIMDPRVTMFRQDETVEETLTRLRTVRDRRILDLCVVDEAHHLVGVIPVQDLVISDPTLPIGDLVHGQPFSIHVMAPEEDVVGLLETHKLTSLPVVDLENRLLGVIRHDALVAAAQENVAEAVQAMFGAGREERALSKATFAVRKRLPWLEINLATAFLAATVVGLFEDTIARITVLAVFLPVVAGQAGNTGSQALAVAMRGLALREIRPRDWLRLVRKEAAVGAVNGVAVALTTSLIVYIWMQSAGLAGVIGVSMVLSMTIAGASGALIPLILKAIGQDPAQSSSIILTTVTDVVGFFSFLGLATIMAGMLGLG